MTKLKDSIDLHKLKAVSANLNSFDWLAKEHDFIEVSEWHNGEGWDITINDKKFNLTEGELKAINYLTSLLEATTDEDFVIDKEKV